MELNIIIIRNIYKYKILNNRPFAGGSMYLKYISKWVIRIALSVSIIFIRIPRCLQLGTYYRYNYIHKKCYFYKYHRYNISEIIISR